MGIYTELRKQYPRTWRIWYRMNKRCELPEPYYKDVGVCDEWSRLISGEQGFIQFLDDMGPCEDTRELCRIDMFYDYTPGNTEWIDNRKITQARKRIWSTEQGHLLKKAKLKGIKYPSNYITYWRQQGANIKQKIKGFKPRESK